MPRHGKPQQRIKRKDEIPDVYRDMLAEAEASSPTPSEENGGRVKRRRVGGRIVIKDDRPAAETAPEHQVSSADDELDDLFEEAVTQRPPIVKSESEDSDSMAQDWEEIDLQPVEARDTSADPPQEEPKELTLVLTKDGDEETHAPRKRARKPLSAVERDLRLSIHKVHVCCLLAHVFIRNHWCNNQNLHANLRRVLTPKIISLLNPSDTMTQFQRSRSFMNGLEQASEIFHQRFQIVPGGITRPCWAQSPDDLASIRAPEDAELPMMEEDFNAAAQRLKGSSDTGAQLFCALLRSAGVDSRLVCSLQTLAFKKDFRLLPLNISDEARTWVMAYDHDLDCPVYWVEVFNEAVQKWVPVDPLVTNTIAKPSKFEPSALSRHVMLAYVIAFEDDGSAHDVTRRYAAAYNAKTRINRVESTKGGDKWWRKAMKLYQRRYRLDRDEIDSAELSKKEASEPMPRGVEDFKHHPYYALERHLRRHEVIHPKREVGKLTVGSGEKARLEPIFRRRDVRQVQSADKWYRSMGREIKVGEQPLKRVAARRSRDLSIHSGDEEEEENAGTSLYAAEQTIPYTAPPVVNGRVPKNIYGNIDIYVATMVPPGGSHIKHPEAVRAAKILGIDFAEAVTGFSFKGRHGTAVTQGAIVASEYYEAVEAVISAMEDERMRAEEAQRSHEALRMWKRLLAGLRIRERIAGYDIEGEGDVFKQAENQTDEDEEMEEEEDSDQGGGFFPAQEAENLAEPTARRTFQQQAPTDSEEDKGGGFVIDDTVSQNGRVGTRASDRFLDNLDDDDGGGFLVEDDHDEAAEEALETGVKADAIAPKSPPQAPFSLPTVLQESLLPNEQEDPKPEANNRAGTLNEETPEFARAPILDNNPFGNDFSPAALDEARLLQQLHESQQLQTQQPDQEEPEKRRDSLPRSIDDDNDELNVDCRESITSPVDAAATKSPTHAALAEPARAENPESDKGSLISEDPEDEDAEPDWLV